MLTFQEGGVTHAKKQCSWCLDENTFTLKLSGVEDKAFKLSHNNKFNFFKHYKTMFQLTSFWL